MTQTQLLVLFSIMISVFVGYISFIMLKYGVQKSVSQTYYVLPKNVNILFTLFCWGFVFPAMIISSHGLMFFAGSGIAFVGAAAAFKGDSMTNAVHMFGAYFGILMSQLYIFFVLHMLYLNIITISVCLLIVILYKTVGFKNTTWWIEMVAFLSIVYALASKIFIMG